MAGLELERYACGWLECTRVGFSFTVDVIGEGCLWMTWAGEWLIDGT